MFGGAAAFGLMAEARAETPALAVIHDQNTSFRAEIRTISDHALRRADAQNAPRFAVRPGVTSGDLETWLERKAREALVIGVDSLRLVDQLQEPPKSYVGLVYLSPDVHRRHSGVTLECDPDTVLASLEATLPDRYRVILVYTPGRDDWLVALLRRSAQMRGFEIVTLPASDLQQGFDQYLTALNVGNPRTDVIWAHAETGLMSPDTLERLVEEAWARRFPVFSSKLDGVAAGFMMGAVPNFEAYGDQLGALVARTSGDPERTIEPMRNFNLALHVRVARNLGVDVTEGYRRQFEIFAGDP